MLLVKERKEKMANSNVAEVRGLLAVLEDAMARCRGVIRQPQPEEAELRECLVYLKLAHADAEYGLVGNERPDWQMLRTAAVDMVSQLLRHLRTMNPELDNWEKARDPAITVQGGRLRSGGRRPFDPQRVRSLYEDEKRKIMHNACTTVPRSDSRNATGSGEQNDRAESRNLETGGTSGPNQRDEGSRPRTPLEPPAASPPPPPGIAAGPGRPRGEQVYLQNAGQDLLGISGRRPSVPAPGYPVEDGPPGGRFYLPATGEDTGSEGYSVREGQGRRRKKVKKNGKYGHQENDLEFFRGAFHEEVSALQHLQLGDDFRYPSDKAFELYFPEFDFVKAMRSNSLRKWDGTIRDYPNFKHTYYRMVFVQREHYMHKIWPWSRWCRTPSRQNCFMVYITLYQTLVSDSRDLKIVTAVKKNNLSK